MAKEKKLTDKVFAQLFLETHKDEHYNFEVDGGDYLVSSGSMVFDGWLDGGFEAGAIRFVGKTSGGKTSAAIEVLDNFLDTVEKSKGIYIKAEGRLSKRMTDCKRHEFTTDINKWEDGTTFIFECNRFETVAEFIRGLSKNFDGTRYCIIIDSMDGLNTKDSIGKSFEEHEKIGAGASITSAMLRNTHLSMVKRGYMCIMLGQARSTIKTHQFQAADRNKLGGASGGNAAVHYANWVLEFIKHNPDNKAEVFLGENDKVLGHKAKVKIYKSPNDTDGQVFEYPIKHATRSVWVEREIVDHLIQWGFIEKAGEKGPWMTLDKDLVEYLTREKIEFSEKLQGIQKIYDWVEGKKDIVDKLKEFIKQNPT